MALEIINKLESIRPFSEREAWGLFKVSAIGEAIGWTLLISALLIRHYHLTGQQYAVPIAGQIHGLLFIFYFSIIIATYSSQGWSRPKFVVGLIAGVVPYGTLVFEQWATHHRRRSLRQAQLCSLMLNMI